MKQLLKELVETPGVSGNEHEIRELIREKVEDEADEVDVDDFGNLIVRKGEGDKTLLLDAHMDQIGLYVKRITEEGFIKVGKVGGIFPENVINQRVTIYPSEGDELRGVLGQKPVHLSRKKKEEPKIPEMEEIFVDIGAEDQEDVEDKGVRIGDRINYDVDFEELEGDHVTGPAFDDRVGCAVAIEALKQFDEDYELVVVFAAQEEVGTKGARTAAFHVDPDVALAIDVSITGDVPGVEPDESPNSIGDGVVIEMIQAGGRGLITPEKIKDWLIDTAEDNDHNYVRSFTDGGGTDAMAIELVRDGIPSGSIGIPLRYMHSSVEVGKISDMEETVEFLESTFSTMEDYF